MPRDELDVDQLLLIPLGDFGRSIGMLTYMLSGSGETWHGACV